MKTALRLVLLTVSALLLPGVNAHAAESSSFLELLFGRNDLEAITVTDMTPAGARRPAASPARPVYYAAVSSGYRDLGGAKAGERPISRGFVDETLIKVLAKQGYLPASAQHPPEIVLVWVWGTLNAKRFFSPDGSHSIQLNHRQLMRFLGGDKLGLTSRVSASFPEQDLLPGLFFAGSTAERISITAEDDLYIATISAYDVPSHENPRPTLLWNTRIGCPSRGFWLPEALPSMLAIGAPFIGRDTPQPVCIRASEKFKPDVRLGDPRVLEYLEANRPSVVEMGPTR